MPSTILPEIVRCNLAPMRHVLDEGERHELTLEQTDELFFLCSFIADAIETRWAAIQSRSRRGIEGRELSVIVRELSSQIDESLQTCARLQTRVRLLSDYRDAENKLSRLTDDIEKVRQIQQQAVALLVWLKASPPPIGLENLKSLEKGPFFRLPEPQTRHGS